MVYLFGQLWLYVLLALGLGLAFSWWATGSSRDLHRLVVRAGLAVLIGGGLLAYAQVARGKLGLWWDIWMLMFLAYVVGCLIAWLLRLAYGEEPATAPLAAPMPMPATKAPPVTAAMPAMAANPMSPKMAAPATEAPAMPASPAGKPAMANPGPFPTAPVLFSGAGGGVNEPEGQGGAASGMAAVTPPIPPMAPAQPGMAAMPGPEPVTMSAAPAADVDPADHFDDADESIIAARPPALSAPNGGMKDDLKRVSGIGRVNEGKLNDLGIFHFSQIGAWTVEHAKWVNGHLAFPGRIQREKWISQAKQLATGADTEFSQRVKAGKVPTSS